MTEKSNAESQSAEFTQQEMEEREAVAFYAGMQVGIIQARPQWSDQRKLKLFHRVVESQQVPVRVIVADTRAIPEFVTAVRATMKWHDETAMLEKMLGTGSTAVQS
jgi:hypothetical protein